MAAVPLASARRPRPATAGLARRPRAERSSSQAEKKALRAHFLTGGNPTALFSPDPFPPEVARLPGNPPRKKRRASRTRLKRRAPLAAPPGRRRGNPLEPLSC